MLRSRRPAPATRAIASVTSTTIIAPRTRRVARPCNPPRPPSFTTSVRLTFAAADAGTRPTRMPAAIVTNAEKRKTIGIELDAIGSGKGNSAHQDDRANCQRRQGKRHGRGRDSDQERLRQERAHDAPSGRPERRSNGHLARAGAAARQHQVGDVDDRQQEQQTGCRERDQHDRSKVTHHRVEQRAHDEDTVPGLVGILLRQAVPHRRHRRADAVRCPAWLEAHEGVERMADRVLIVLREPQVGVARNVERCSSHADDER